VRNCGRDFFRSDRLAIIDPLPEANQPFASHDDRFLLVWNGELYNYRELRKELETHGVRFRTRSDSEVLLEAFRLWGESALPRFSAMFAVAIWDQAERSLFCARDRAGEKPFYYAILGETFLFASEPKAFLSSPTFARRIHYPALLDYLAYGFVPDPKCIWESGAKLPPGHCMVVRTGADGTPSVQEPHPWWDWEFEPEPNERDWTSRVLGTLTSAAREMTVAHVPVGVFLSGGVDSSSVVAALARGGEGWSSRRTWTRSQSSDVATSTSRSAITRSSPPITWRPRLADRSPSLSRGTVRTRRSRAIAGTAG
jgi:asparagine synthase (glutamine-hydrolysing)